MTDIIRITVDPDEVPDSHSASKQHEDEHGDYYFGRSNSYDDFRAVATATLKKLNICVHGGESFKEYIKENKDKMGWHNAVLFYMIQHLIKDKSLSEFSEILVKIAENNFEEGFKLGEENVKKQFRKLIGCC